MPSSATSSRLSLENSDELEYTFEPSRLGMDGPADYSPTQFLGRSQHYSLSHDYSLYKQQVGLLLENDLETPTLYEMLYDYSFEDNIVGDCSPC